MIKKDKPKQHFTVSLLRAELFLPPEAQQQAQRSGHGAPQGETTAPTLPFLLPTLPFLLLTTAHTCGCSQKRSRGGTVRGGHGRAGGSQRQTLPFISIPEHSTPAAPGLSFLPPLLLPTHPCSCKQLAPNCYYHQFAFASCSYRASAYLKPPAAPGEAALMPSLSCSPPLLLLPDSPLSGGVGP